MNMDVHFASATITVILCVVFVAQNQGATQKVCWSHRWFNESTPTAVNRSEYEHPPAQVLDSICPYGHVIAAMCKDSKGESFEHFRNDTANQYMVTCNVKTGLICIPYTNSIAFCPDFAISYGCSCPTTTTTTTMTTTTTTTTPTATRQLPANYTNIQLEDTINVSCTGSHWNITANMNSLKLLYPSIRETDLYFGQNKCAGRLKGSNLLFQQSLNSCATTKQTESDREIFKNSLFYVIFDPVHTFIVRKHIWTFAVECDVMKTEATSSHVDHNTDLHNTTFNYHPPVSMAFFSDPNFKNQISGNPLPVNLGENVFVKVFTTMSDWNIKMRLDMCYTTPSGSSTRDMDLVLIKNGCEVDSNTHILSQSTHETRFMYKDFEYFNNQRGLDIYCNATFCYYNDFTAGCLQTCHSGQI